MIALSKEELDCISAIIEALDSVRVAEVGFPSKVTIYDSNGDVCGTVENFAKGNESESHYYYPGEEEPAEG